MMSEASPVGANRALETLVGEKGEADRRIHPVVRLIVRNWGFLLSGFVFAVVWLPARATPAGSIVLSWLACYTLYLFALEILGKAARRLYDAAFFRLFRIHFNLAMITVLALVAPSTASNYLWFFFAMPILATLGYFGRPIPTLVIYLEVCAAILLVTFAQGGVASLDLAAMVGQDVILGLLTVVLYLFVRFFPRLREESALLGAATALIQVFDRKELAQLLADAAKAGVPASDAAVVHLLESEDSQILVPLGSSHLVLTTLGRTPMKVGVGIAGHAIQDRRTLNVPDVNEDSRFVQLRPSFTSFKSLLVAPMYVGDKNIGAISVHSGRREAFDERDERFLTMLAAQGATALANAELYGTHTRRRQQISDILEAGRAFGLNQPLDTLLETIAAETCRCSGFQMAVVNLVDEANGEIVVRAMAGVPPEGKRKLEAIRIPLGIVALLLRDEFRISRSYFIRHDHCPEILGLDQYTFAPDLGERKLGEWHSEDMLIVPIQTQERQLLGYISVDDPGDRRLPSLDTVQALEILASVAATAIQNSRLYEALQQELAERKRAEEALRQRNRELELLNRAGQAFGSILDLDQVLVAVLEEVRRLLNVVASSIWLIDSETGELVCWQATGPQMETVRGWRLASGEGIAGWVARHGESIVVPDAQADERHFTGVDERTGLVLRSILSVPMRVKQDVIGVLQVVDTEVGRFKSTDLTLIEPLAAAAAIAIENARLYEETSRLRTFNENIVQSMEEGILLEDASAHITFVNRMTAELLGYAYEELIGQRSTVIAAPEEVPKIERETAKRPFGIASRYETVLLTREGRRVPVIVSAKPLVEEGLFTGVLAVFTDITDRKRQETRLWDCFSTVTSSLAQHNNLDGLYEFIVEAGRRFLSARDCALFLVTDENRGALKLVATVVPTRCGGSAIGTTINIGPGCGLVAHVAETRQPIRLVGDEILRHPSWREEIWTKLGWDFDPQRDHSILAVPMCAPDGCLAVVLVARDAESRDGFSEFDQVLLETLATNAVAEIERVRGLEKARQDAVRAERKRLETDLHEAMNILATGVRWEAEILSDEIERNDLAAASVAMTRLQAALTRAYTDLRYMLEDLRDPTLEQKGLLVALKSRAELIGHGHIVVHGDFEERLPTDVEGILYRVGQEAMINAVKHCGVVDDPNVKIEVQLERAEGQVRLCVRDNGVGFDVDAVLALPHKWGLRRLRDILHDIGGGLTIDSVPGQGTTICAAITLLQRKPV